MYYIGYISKTAAAANSCFKNLNLKQNNERTQELKYETGRFSTAAEKKTIGEKAQKQED